MSLVQHPLATMGEIYFLIEPLMQIVSKRTATIGVVNENVIPLDGKDHRQICRIKNEHEAAYQKIVQQCRSIGTGSVGRSRG